MRGPWLPGALTMTPQKELAGAVTEPSRDVEVCVLVPTGAGKGFC
jgi:hypothetical protein